MYFKSVLVCTLLPIQKKKSNSYPDKSIAEIERVLKKNGHVLLQITVGEATDKYGVTEIKSERGIIKLFKNDNYKDFLPQIDKSSQL